MNTDILSMLTGTTVYSPATVIRRGYSDSDTTVAGCFINTQNVYSICTGVVIAVEQAISTNTWCVTVEINSKLWIRYCELSATSARIGVTVKPGDFLGYANNHLLRFEYCNSDKSKFPVRTTNRQLYKHDPTPILFGQIDLNSGG